MNFELEWERQVLSELNQEYVHICRSRKLQLRPVSIRLFDSETLWGQFDALTRTISLSRKLIHRHTWQQVLGVLRHEMAHQLTHETNPDEAEQKPHGPLFQEACRKLGVPAQFAKSKIGFQDSPLDWKEGEEESAQSKMLDKVKKLLALAQSTNEHEAGLAMKKVQEIYAQYNLDRADFSDRSQFVHLIVSEGKKRRNAWEQRIISLLIEHFFVEIILLQQFNPQTAEREQAFEMIGTRENVLMAEYVYHFLRNQVEILTRKTGSSLHPFSRTEKSSFRLGILEGFCEKLRTPKRPPETEPDVIEKALMKFKEDPFLENYLKEIYPRLSFRKNSSRLVDMQAFQSGQQEGKKLVLHKPLESSKASLGGLLNSIRLS